MTSPQLWIDAAKVEAHGEAAERIVAALKAVEGIPTKALQDGCLKDLLGGLVAFYEQDESVDPEHEMHLLERLGMFERGSGR